MTTLSTVPAMVVVPFPDNYLTQTQAQALDQTLFQSFTLSQLMELAGLSVACAVQHSFPSTSSTPQSVLIFAGPGNNGGDALVAARHLYHFGFRPTLVYPKLGKTSLFVNLLQQCQDLGIPILKEWHPPLPAAAAAENANPPSLILDGVFGFSFQPSRGVRAPYDIFLQFMRTTSIPVVSIDVPSGWDVEQGDNHNVGVRPTILISLTAPKVFAQTMLPPGARHFLGGRFLPPSLAQEYGLERTMSLYSGSNQIVELANPELETKTWGGERVLKL